MFLTRRKARSFDDTIAMLDASGAESTGGVYVNGVNAMRQATVWACVRIHSEIIAQLPIEIQRREGSTWNTVQDHDLLQLIHDPNDWQTKHDLISFIIGWSEQSGNAYLFKNSAGGKVRRLLPLESSSVEANTDRKDWTIEYDVANEKIQGRFRKDKIFHLRNFGSDGQLGISTIATHRKSVGLALELENHAYSAYKDGLLNNKWVEMEQPITDPKKLAQFKRTIRSYKGSGNSGEIPVLAKAKFHEFGRMSAVDAQYIESRRMQKAEIASIFGIPLFLLNETEKSTTWGSGLEQITKTFVRFSLSPRLNRLSEFFIKDLLEPREASRTRIRFDTDQFTLGEFKERMEGYRHAIESGVLNPDECREKDGLNARPKGSKYRIPANIFIEGQENANETSDETV